MDGKLAVAVGALVAAWAAASMCWRGGLVVCGCEPCGRNGAACGHCMGEAVGEIMELMAQSWWGNDTDWVKSKGWWTCRWRCVVMRILPVATCGYGTCRSGGDGEDERLVGRSDGDGMLGGRDVWL